MKRFAFLKKTVLEPNSSRANKRKCYGAMTPQTKIVRLFYDEMWNRADKSRIPEIFQADFTFRGSLGPVLVGHEQFAGYVEDVVRALPDFRCDILETTEQDDRVVAKMKFSGTHAGTFFGFAPTGKRVAWDGSAHFTFRAGLVADLWVLGDVHGLLQRLAANRDETKGTG